MVTKKLDRRSHPRKSVAISGQIVCHTGDHDISLQTHNVSCSGLYCRVSRYLPPFTGVNVAMALPLHNGKKSAHNEMIAFKGVVVRTDPEKEVPGCDDYHVAVFFSGITEKARDLITRYLLEHGVAAPSP